MLDIQDILKYRVSEVGDIGLCDIGGCRCVPENYVILSQFVNGISYTQAGPVFLCNDHFMEYLRELCKDKKEIVVKGVKYDTA